MNLTVIVAGMAVLSAGFCFACYRYFYGRENRMMERLMRLVEQAQNGSVERMDISEEKVSALEDCFKRYIDDSLLENGNQKRQKEIIQELISDISHQTLTPISNLKLYTQLLRERMDDPAGMIKTIQEQTEKLDFQIQSLVKLSRMESGMITVQPKKDNIGALFAALKKEYQKKADEKEIALKVQETELWAEFDMKWTVEAVGNLVDNAVKYTKPGGNVTVSAKAYTFFIRVDVSDDGIGIAKEECPKIFSRFYRSFTVADEPGVGIGLYLAKELIQAQKGYVKVKSEKGAGSLFSVFLPV